MENKFENIDFGWDDWGDNLVFFQYVEDLSEEAKNIVKSFEEFDKWYNMAVKVTSKIEIGHSKISLIK